LIFGRDSDAVVFHRNHPVVRSFGRGHLDARRLLGTVFQRIADQVLEYLG
jgi:hypothetical protein